LLCFIFYTLYTQMLANNVKKVLTVNIYHQFLI